VLGDVEGIRDERAHLRLPPAHLGPVLVGQKVGRANQHIRIAAEADAKAALLKSQDKLERRHRDH